MEGAPSMAAQGMGQGKEGQREPSAASITDELVCRQLLDELPVLAWATDVALRFTWSRGGGLATLGLRAEQLIGMTVEGYFGDSAAATSPLAAHRAALEGKRSEFELDFSGRSFRCRVQPLRDSGGTCIGTMGHAFDVAGPARPVDAPHVAQGGLGPGDAERLEAFGRVTGGLVHDFNNVLQTLVGHAHRIASALPDGGEHQADVVQILGAAERATSLARQLLAFGRGQVARAEVPAVLNLGHLVARARPLLERLIGPEVPLEVSVTGVGFVQADEAHVEQVLTSLALSAAEGARHGSVLTIDVRQVSSDDAHLGGVDVPPGRYVLLTVQERGRAGVIHGPEAPATLVTLPRGEEGRDGFKAAGIPAAAGIMRLPSLGLGSVYGIVRRSRGHVVVESDARGRSSFSVFWPAVVPEPRDATPTASSTSHPAPLLGEETILLVDDEPAVRMFVRRSLEEYGYRVLEAGGVDEALALGESYPGLVHLLLTDVVLPGMNGTQLAARLAPVRPEMRILYMTGHADDAVVHRGVLAAGQALLVKPFTPLGLAHEVKKVLRL